MNARTRDEMIKAIEAEVKASKGFFGALRTMRRVNKLSNKHLVKLYSQVLISKRIKSGLEVYGSDSVNNTDARWGTKHSLSAR